MNLIIYKQYETIELFLVTVLQSVNRDCMLSFIPYLKTYVATMNLRAFHFLFHQLKVSVAIVEPKRFWRYELKDGLKGGIELLPC